MQVSFELNLHTFVVYSVVCYVLYRFYGYVMKFYHGCVRKYNRFENMISTMENVLNSSNRLLNNHHIGNILNTADEFFAGQQTINSITTAGAILSTVQQALKTMIEFTSFASGVSQMELMRMATMSLGNLFETRTNMKYQFEDQPSDRSKERSKDQSSERSKDQSSERSKDQSSERSKEQSKERSEDQSEEQSSEESEEEFKNTFEEKLREQFSEQTKKSLKTDSSYEEINTK